MSIPAVIRDLQAHLEQDVDSLWEEFVEEHGSPEPGAFVRHLAQHGLLDATVAEAALKGLPSPALAPPEAGPGEAGQAGRAKRAPQAFRRTTGGNLRASSGARGEPRNLGATALPPAEQEYTMLGTIGEGAMGRVYRARDSRLHRRVAYKAMNDEVANQAILARKFRSEVEITAQLDHPNIVPVYELDTDRAYTMKLIQGRTLASLVEEARNNGDRDPRGLEQRLEWFLKVCDALHYAHTRGVIHRDLKPENIMIGSFGEVYVMDWGIARRFSTEVDDPVELSLPSEDEGELIIGTPGYMSPEQADGRNSALNALSDQYSLGLILFELLSLNPAVTGKAPLKIVMRHQDGETDRLVHAAGKKLPPELVAIVRKATAKDTQRRYASVQQLAEDLRRFLRGEAVLARPDPPLQALLRFMGRHRELTLGLVMLLIAGGGVLLLSLFAGTQIALSRAEAQKQRLSGLLTTVARQSSLIDGQFLKYEGLLNVLATLSVERVQRGLPAEEELLVTSAFDAGQVRGALEGARYGSPVTLDRLAVNEVLDPLAQEDLRQLAPLAPQLQRLLLRSLSEEAAAFTPKRAERAIIEVGVPVAWTHIALANGAYLTYPGHGGIPASYDARQSVWYNAAQDSAGPHWGAPAVDPGGLGLVLTVSQRLREGEETLGVVGLDMTFDYLVEELLQAPEFRDTEGVEAFLLDPEGRIVVRSSKKGSEARSALKNRTLRMQEFHQPELVQAVKERRSGWLAGPGPAGNELVVYNRLHSIGWTYVVSGPPSVLLSAAGEN